MLPVDDLEVEILLALLAFVGSFRIVVCSLASLRALVPCL